MNVLGVDLAWGEGSGDRAPNETGVVAVDRSGRILDAGWTVGVAATAQWMATWAGDDSIAMVDAPLVVHNATGQRPVRAGGRPVLRPLEGVGQQLQPRPSGARRGVAAAAGWRLTDGPTPTARSGPPRSGRHVYEVYPYTTLVGAAELGYELERPAYKRRPRSLDAADVPPPSGPSRATPSCAASSRFATPIRRSTCARTR